MNTPLISNVFLKPHSYSFHDNEILILRNLKYWIKGWNYLNKSLEREYCSSFLFQWTHMDKQINEHIELEQRNTHLNTPVAIYSYICGNLQVVNQYRFRFNNFINKCTWFDFYELFETYGTYTRWGHRVFAQAKLTS